MTKSKKEGFAFGKENYVMMIAGLVIIAVGYMLMTGGRTEDPNIFNPEIFNTRRLTVAPVVILIGFVVEIFAIMKKTKE